MAEVSPMMRSRSRGAHCRVQGHGIRCDAVPECQRDRKDDLRDVERELEDL